MKLFTCPTPHDKTIVAAAKLIRQGKILIHPTENLYGFGARFDSPSALEQIRIIKGRKKSAGYIILISDIHQLEQLVKKYSATEKKIMAAFWPGSLTLILQAQDTWKNSLFTIQGTIAVRMVNNPFTRAVIDDCNIPIVSTSINKSGEPPLLERDEIITQFSHLVDGMLLPTKDSGSSAPSTIISAKNNAIQIIRNGAISEQQIRQALPNIKIQY